jgi:hypothetical protein
MFSIMHLPKGWQWLAVVGDVARGTVLLFEVGA